MATAQKIKKNPQRKVQRWTEDQVKLLLDTVKTSDTNSRAFETVGRELGKSAGTVQQKYYSLQRGGESAPTRPVDASSNGSEESNTPHLKLRLICKDRVKQIDGSLTYVAMYVDPQANVTALLVKRPNDDWRGEVFRGEEGRTFGETDLTPIGRFPLHRLSVSGVTEMSIRCMRAYEQRVSSGGQRLVYEVK